MSKNSIIKAVGFVGTLAAGAALVGSAVTGTGAYFTSSKTGTLAASSGHLTLNTTDTNLAFSDLMPGEDKTKNIDFNTDSEGKSDVWVVFDKTSPAYGAFSGSNTEYAGGGLGRYAHFAVSVNGGQPVFESYNVKNRDATDTTSLVCYVDANGNGGSAVRASSPTDTPPYCGVPGAIRIAQNLSNGEGRTLNVTFGLTGRWKGQHATLATVPFQVVATQAGVRPDALNY